MPFLLSNLQSNLLNHIVSTVKQLVADDILFFIAHNAKSSAEKLSLSFKSKTEFILSYNS